jgi:hypothetical protein
MTTVTATISDISTDDLRNVIENREAQRIAALPEATEQMMAEYCGLLRGLEGGKCDWLNKTHRISDDGEDLIAIAKADHRLSINTTAAREGITELVKGAKRLTGFKYKITNKGITFKVSGKAAGIPTW